MSAGACLADLEAQGVLDAARAADARALYDELLAEYRQSGSREAAEALATRDLIDAMETMVTRKEFLAGRTIKVRNRIAGDLLRYDGQRGMGGRGGGGGPIDPRAGPAFFNRDPRAPYSNVEARRKSVVSAAHRLLDDMMERFSTNIAGSVRNKAQLRNVTRELFGESTGDAAAAGMATAWRKSAEMLRQRFNAAGGNIGFRSDWGMPQSHDWKAVRKAGFDEWAAFIRDRLDVGKMVDLDTGKPMTRAKLEQLLPDIFRQIRSEGWDKRAPGGQPKVASLANRRADARFFVFRDADAWMEYAEAYGQGTAYDAMMGHIEGMARDIAALEILGPNPNATINWLKETILASAQRDMDPGSKGVKRAENAGEKIDELWQEYSGANWGARNEALALGFSTYRAFATSTKLGSAFLSAMSDFAFSRSSRAFNGLSQATMLPQYLKLFVPGSIEDQKLAVRLGLIAEEWSSRTAAQSRYLTEELTGGFSRRLAEGVLRLSLLSRHTQTMRWVNGMEWLSQFTVAAERTFDNLPDHLREALGRRGIDAAEWDTLRKAKMKTQRGVEWMDPTQAGDDALASRFMEVILEDTDIAVPVSDLATRAAINTGLPRGTLKGELGRSAFQFKGFGISVILAQWQRIMAMTPARAAPYTIGLVVGTTLTGAIGLQLKALAAGKDPRPMDDGTFWNAAVMQGGGFGIFGDFLFADQNRYGGSFAQTMMGPLADDAQGAYNLATAEDPRTQLVREAKGWVPGNNLWYVRLALDRMVADQIDMVINPRFGQRERGQQRFAAEEGTSFWWRPGSPAPYRSPDYANAIEGETPE
ncbi:hypothetical protein [Aurantiacibacter zhengii]|uniref:Uncharacterized protein n=1 Tax=Aurantiacibacter zhengii TaxID=2307003 RepID=A0A418NUB6_9SPHN|nr:hypothetical protein [Aurantiacibacter zhengii]RIV87508.1 hypothetical protein D2V07_03920 [Aurantiacibacter zhengii]